MRKVAKPATMLLALWLSAFPAFAETGTDEAAILQRLHEACEAYERGDADYLENFLAEGYTLTGTRGNVTHREDDLAQVRSGEPQYEVFRNHGMVVRFYGEDTAIVNGITSLKGTFHGEPFELDAQFTDTMVKQDGVWMLAASHATRIEKPDD